VEDWCDEIVMRFAVQAMINAVGAEAVKAWMAAHQESAHLPAQFAEDDMDVAEGGVDGEASALQHGLSSLAAAAEEYFADETVQALFPVVGTAEREAYSKRAIQLLSQLSVVHPPLLAAIPQLYSAWASSSGVSSEATIAETEERGESSEDQLQAEQDAGAEMDEAGVSAVGDVQEGEEATEGQVVAPAPGKFALCALAAVCWTCLILDTCTGKAADAWTLAETLKAELRNILPAIAQGRTAEGIFDILSAAADSSTRPLLAYALSVLLYDVTSPPTQGLMDKVKAFAQRQQRLREGRDGVPDTLNAAGAEETKETAMDVEVSAGESGSLLDAADVEDFKLVLPLLGGVAGSDVERCLPRIVGLFAEQPDALKVIFDRITKARPPPLTKAALLVTLHR
jgi:hypothetical protein